MQTIRKKRPAIRPHGTWFRRLELRVGAVCFCAALFMVPILAPGATSSDKPAGQNCRLTLLARQALLQDAVLAPLNLGVSVKDHVATLWGPVPYGDLKRRAENRVLSVQGIAEVVNELYVDAASEPAVAPVVEPQQSMPLQAPGFEPVKPILDPVRKLPPPPAIPQPPKENPQPSLTRTVGNQGQRLQADATGIQPINETVQLMPAMVLPQPGPAPIRPISPIAPIPHINAPTPNQGSTLAQAIDRLRLSEPRYQRIQVEVNAGVVSLYGQVARMEYAIELAQSISRQPGVQRVVLANVKADR